MISQQNLSTPSRPFHLPPLSLPVQPLAEPILLGSDDEGEIDDPLRKDQLRRISHSAIEKRRREKIKDKIGVLRSIVPICSKQHTVNKLSILEHTITYIHYLKDLVVSYSEENAELRQMLDGQSYAAPDQAALPPAALPQPAYSSASGEHQPRHQQPQRQYQQQPQQHQPQQHQPQYQHQHQQRSVQNHHHQQLSQRRYSSASAGYLAGSIAPPDPHAHIPRHLPASVAGLPATHDFNAGDAGRAACNQRPVQDRPARPAAPEYSPTHSPLINAPPPLHEARHHFQPHSPASARFGGDRPSSTFVGGSPAMAHASVLPRERKYSSGPSYPRFRHSHSFAPYNSPYSQRELESRLHDAFHSSTAAAAAYRAEHRSTGPLSDITTPMSSRPSSDTYSPRSSCELDQQVHGGGPSTHYETRLPPISELPLDEISRRAQSLKVSQLLS